jgi:hypothetical protein
VLKECWFIVLLQMFFDFQTQKLPQNLQFLISPLVEVS